MVVAAEPQSPSSEAVLAAIRAVTGPAGCLLIVKSYTGACHTHMLGYAGSRRRIPLATA